MSYSNYKSLSNSLESEALEPYFREFLSIYRDKPKTKKALSELYELAYRQWDTYEALNEEVAQALSEYLISAINFNSYEIMDTIISIVEKLSLKRVFDYILQQKRVVKNKSVLTLIEEAEEYGSRIEDPFDVDDF